SARRCATLAGSVRCRIPFPSLAKAAVFRRINARPQGIASSPQCAAAERPRRGIAATLTNTIFLEVNMDLSNASALVTGGAGGFGEATVRRLVAAGAKVVIADLDEARGQELATALGDSVRFVKTDVLSEESVAAAIGAAT